MLHQGRKRREKLNACHFKGLKGLSFLIENESITSSEIIRQRLSLRYTIHDETILRILEHQTKGTKSQICIKLLVTSTYNSNLTCTPKDTHKVKQ